VEPRRKFCTVGLPPDTQRTTAKRHSVDTPTPHSTPSRLPRTCWLAGRRVSETADIAKSSASKKNKANNFGVTVIFIFDIVQRRGEKKKQAGGLVFFLPQSLMVHFGCVSLHPATEEQRHTHFHGIDTVRKRAGIDFFFLLVAMFLLLLFLIYWIAVEAICSS